MLLFYKEANMLANLGIMLFLNRTLTKEELEEKAKKRKKLLEERKKRIQDTLDEEEKTKELFFGQDIEVEDILVNGYDLLSCKILMPPINIELNCNLINIGEVK